MTLDTLFEREARQAVSELIAGVLETMGAGMLGDHAEYKYQAGRVAAFRQVLESFEDVNKKLQER